MKKTLKSIMSSLFAKIFVSLILAVFAISTRRVPENEIVIK